MRFDPRRRAVECRFRARGSGIGAGTPARALYRPRTAGVAAGDRFDARQCRIIDAASATCGRLRAAHASDQALKSVAGIGLPMW